MNKDKLMSNWGDQAEALACFAEARFYDKASTWECFLLAIDPDDEDTVKCIVKTNAKAHPTVETWSLQSIFSCFNEYGETPTLDNDFKPRRAAELFKSLCI